jgi:Electron transfer DM13
MPFLSIFGEIESLIADHLYPYRYVVTPLLALAGAAAAYIAFRLGLHKFVGRHRLTSVIIGVPVVIVAVVAGNYFLSPLWERNFLDEASPLEAAAAAGQPGMTASNSRQSPSTAPEARTTARGMFKGADEFHFGRGDALIIRTEAGANVLRVENFSVRNGPDLFVYLSRDESGKRVEESLNLGKLKATDGAFNYEIPVGLDLTGVKSVVVWCRQFAVQFAVAPLMVN